MSNCELRSMAKEKNVKLWQIAKFLGISEPTLTRWLREPLSEKRKADFIAAVVKISES